MKHFIIISLFLSFFLPKTKPILQKTYNSQCPNCPAQISLGSTRKIPVYVPIPVFTLYQIPILHHYPLNQVVRQMTPIPIEIPIEHRINRPYPVPIPVEQKILIPQPVPYGVKVPIPIPIQRKCENCDNNGTEHKNNTDNNYRNLSIQINNLVQQSLKADFDRLNLGENIKNAKEFDINDLGDLLAKPENSSKSQTKFMNKTELKQNNDFF